MKKLPTPKDMLNKRTLSATLLLTVLLTGFLTYNFWFIEKPLVKDEEDDGAPFEISSHHVLFEIGAGSFISLKPKQTLKHEATVEIQLDDPNIINTIGSFTVKPDSQRTIFIPLHSKKGAGHCIMSFKSKSPEMEGLYKLRIRIKVVHYLLFGYLSILLGWGYFLVWSCSYYPQIYQNLKRRSVIGLSFDYVSLSVTGHLCYCIFNAAMYYNSSMQKAYTKLHPKGELPVKMNDNFFSIHAVTMNVIIITQICFFERGGQKPSIAVVTLVGGLWLSIFGAVFAGITEKITWLQFVYYLSYIKVGSTPIKYTPQVHLNYTRKSTEGWSVHTVWLDGTGGLLSLMQIFVDAFNYDDWEGTLGNPGKLGLSFIAMVYNGIFLVQHYILYKSSKKSLGPKSPPPVENDKVFKQQLEQLKMTFSPSKTYLQSAFDL